MKLEIDTDKALQAGFRWVRVHVPALPAALTFLAFLCWNYEWSMTYTPQPWPPGFEARCWMMGISGFFSVFASIAAWVNYFDNRRRYN